MSSSSQIDRLYGPMLLFSALFLPGYLYQSAEGAAVVFSSNAMLLQTLVICVPQALLILYIIITRGRPDARSAGIVMIRPSDSLRILGVLTGIAVLSAPIALIGKSFGVGGFVEVVGTKSDPLSFFLLALVCLAIGYREELFFRSYLLSEFALFGKYKAVAASTALFAVGHIYQGGIAFLGTALIGVFLSFVFLRYRNVHTIAIGHGLYNLAVVLLGKTT